MSTVTEEPGVTLEELLDLAHVPPCEMHRLLLGRRWDRPCTRPSAFRVRIACGNCGRQETAFYCRPHVRDLRNGRVMCLGCGDRLSWLGTL